MLRILIVEDNPQVADVASSLLMERGHAVIRVGDAEEALHVLNSGQTFDLVLSDMVMPGRMNGLDLARRIRDRWPSLAVLLATGYSEAASRATREGFALVSKPYQPHMLVEAIHRTASPGSDRLREGNVVSLPRGNARRRGDPSGTAA